MNKIKNALTTTTAIAALIAGFWIYNETPNTHTNNTHTTTTQQTGNNNYITQGKANFGTQQADIDLALKQSKKAQDNHKPAPKPRLINHPNGAQTVILTATDRAIAKARGRQPLDTDPQGWPDSNPKVQVHFPTGVNYKGYFWNRSHLIADSLGGLPEENNLVAGTRAQNVGDNHAPGGMAYTETLARDFLDNQLSTTNLVPSNEPIRLLEDYGISETGKGEPLPETVDVPEFATCDLAYQAVPNFELGEKIPRSVTVNIKSCDGTIDEQVEVANSMPGFGIDYLTGAISEN